MARIKQLSPHVANLIAAGEVVERPGSVVKELTENAIDAGAKTITVELQNGGMTFLRVTDDGCGMAPEDAEVAFLRHATSKISGAEDLDAITTMGFRGEALAAISSVSHIDLLTKSESSPMGYTLHLDAGTITERGDAGCPNGTTMIVRNLFYNTPARMKFMKSDTAEAANIISAVQKQALAHPEISFRVIKDGQEVFQTPGDGHLGSVIYCLYGRDFANQLVPVESKWDNTRIWGYVTRPTATRGNRSYQQFFVNGRPVKSKTMTSALEEAYRNQMMANRFPGCVLHVELPPRLVDVNVHPAKLEVKFLSEKAIFDCIHYGVLAALQKASAKPEMKLDSRRSGQKKLETNENFYKTMTAQEYRQFAGQLAQASYSPVSSQTLEALKTTRKEGVEKQIQTGSCPISEREPNLSVRAPVCIPRSCQEATASAHKDAPYLPVPDWKGGSSLPESWAESSPAGPVLTGRNPLSVAENLAVGTSGLSASVSKNGMPGREDPLSSVSSDTPGAEASLSTAPAGWNGRSPEAEPLQQSLCIPEEDFRIVGEVLDTYLIVEQGKNVYFIDKHAAHERILFEKLKAEDHPIMAQSLITPLVADLDREEAAIVLENASLLLNCGFEVDDLGDGVLILRQIPADLPVEDAVSSLAALAEDLLQGKSLDPASLRDHLLHTIACKAAIKAGYHTESAERDSLVRQVLTRDDIRYCPHGRPVCICLSQATLEKQFKRA